MLIFGWIWENMKKWRALYIFGLFITVITAVMIIINPYVSGEIIDTVFVQQRYDMLLPYMAILAAVQLARTSMRYGMIMIFETVSQNFINGIRRTLYTNLQRQDMRFYSENRTGDIMAKMSGDLEAVRHLLSWVLYNGLECIVMYVSSVIFLLSINVYFTLCMLALSPAILFMTLKLSRRMRPLYTQVRDEFSNLNTAAQENISGNRVVKAFTREEYEIQKFKVRNDAYRGINIFTMFTWLKYGPAIEFAAQALAVIATLAGGIFAVNGTLTLGQFNVFSSLAWTLSHPLRMISTVLNDLQRGMASADKVLTLYYAKPDIVNPENPVKKDRIDGNIRFENVSLKIGNQIVLSGINLDIKAGETVAIMGPTGSGKTMLTNLIPRFYDVASGAVYVDGVDVRCYDLQNLRKNIGMATQDVFLFSDTIEGNIAFGDPDLDVESVKHYANLAAAASFIEQMPEGYDTIIGERGVGLSGGQKQRIALARALAIRPSILILDDTTSAVDMETEKYIQNTLKNLDFSCTKIIIAQRISSVKNADKIMIIENGKIAEMGRHEDLLKNKGYYYDIYMLQHGESCEAMKEAALNG